MTANVRVVFQTPWSEDETARMRNEMTANGTEHGTGSIGSVFHLFDGPRRVPSPPVCPKSSPTLSRGSMNEVTTILNAIGAGDPGAVAQLLPLVYDELRRLAAARMATEW